MSDSSYRSVGAPRVAPVIRYLSVGLAVDELHQPISFCEVRCGSCKLFTRIGAPGEMTTAYLDAIERQSRVVAECVGDGTHCECQTDGMIGLGCGSGSYNTGGSIACSDAVGPTFFSDSIRRDMADSEAK